MNNRMALLLAAVVAVVVVLASMSRTQGPTLAPGITPPALPPAAHHAPVARYEANGSAVSSPVTLDDLVGNDKLLWVYCCECGHERDVNPAAMPHHPETPVPENRQAHEVLKCGSRKINTKPELYPGGVEAMRSRRL